MKSKKSLIIAPALAALFVAAAGSVSGTVAWFSSVRVFSTTVADFSVVETDGNLEATMTPGQGTVSDGVGGIKVKDSSNPVVLTHGSVNTSSKNAYTLNSEGGVNYFQLKGAAEDTNWLYKANVTAQNSDPAGVLVDVYVALSWTVRFTYNFASDTSPVAIYLDLADSEFTLPTPASGLDFRKDAKTGHVEDTQYAFRIGFYGTQSYNFTWGHNTLHTGELPSAWNNKSAYSADDLVLKDNAIYKCISPVTAKEEAEEPNAWSTTNWQATGKITLNDDKVTDAKYVSGLAKGNTTNYTASNFVVCKDQERVAEKDTNSEYDNVATAAHPERVCVLDPEHNSYTVTCAAWFEGTDPNVVSGAYMNCLKAKMSFYARTINHFAG